MNKYIVKSTCGRYFVSGRGFSTVCAKEATVFANSASANATVDCAKNMGITANVETVKADKSFGVCYIRKADLNADFSVRANAKNPSRRRFATEQEAVTHGSRFATRKAKGSRVAGSAGHVGFYVVETTDPVTDAINPQTGLTNRIGE